MTTHTLWVPFEVLNAPNYTACTRLVWLLQTREPGGTSPAERMVRLRRLTGLDSKTVATALCTLAGAPSSTCSARPHPSWAAIPMALLTNTNLLPGARLLYGQLQGVQGFAQQRGSFTYATLSHLTGSSDDALRRATSQLVAAGWLTVTQSHRKSPLHFTLHNPVASRLTARISAIRRKVRGAQHRGETLLREFLNVMVALDHSKDTDTPDFLLNPYTKELMDFDRYYPSADVAFEFNGLQHYERTNIATYEKTVKQVGRDAMKAFICKDRGIELVIIHPEDLSLQALEAKIPARLPRRDLTEMAPLVVALEGLAAEYRERTAEERSSHDIRAKLT